MITKSGGSDTTVPAATQALADLTPQDLMALPTPKERPAWMLTRYPVSMEEFRKLTEAAAKVDRRTMAAATDGAAVDADEAQEFTGDLPEDGAGAAAPASLAPTTLNSFQGIPATGWQPPDNTIAVGPNDVLLGVNTDLAGYSKTGTLKFRWNNMTALFRNVLPSGATIFTR